MVGICHTEVDGDSFRASAAVPSGEPCEVLVKFKYYAPVRTLSCLKRNRAANVAGPVTGPAIADTDLGEIVNRGILKAWEPKFDVYSCSIFIPTNPKSCRKIAESTNLTTLASGPAGKMN